MSDVSIGAEGRVEAAEGSPDRGTTASAPRAAKRAAADPAAPATGAARPDLIGRWTAGGRRIDLPLKWTFSLILGLVVIAFVASAYVREKGLIESHFAETGRAISQLLHHQLEAEASRLEKLLLVIERDGNVARAFASRDRADLIEATSKLFGKLQREHQVTHLYFMDANRVSLLRAHRPSLHGDKVEHVTTREAERTRAVAKGLELGKLGAFTLRVAKPRYLNGTLVGYIEIGKEIGTVLNGLERSLDVLLVEAYHKHFLDYKKWKLRNISGRRQSSWKMSEHFAIISSNIRSVPRDILEHIDSHDSGGAAAERDDGAVADRAIDTSHVMTNLRGEYKYIVIPLRDLENRQVGHIIAIKSISGDIISFIKSQSFVIAFALVFCGIAGVVFGRVARSVGRSVATHQALLDDEVRQRTRELKVSEARLREAQRVASFGSWDWDIVTNELYWSDEIYQLFGVATHEFAPSYEAFMRFVHPDDRESLEKAVRGAVLYREPCNIEHRIVRADGETRFVLVRARVTYAENGRAVRMLGIVQDITERRRAADLKQRFGRILEASLNEIYVFDGETYRFVQVNEGARRNLGYTMQELRDLTPWDIKPQISEERFRDIVEPLRRGRTEVLRFETEHLRRDGSVYPVEVRLQFFCEEWPPVFVAIINDVTERRKAERDIKALNKSLERRVEERTAELKSAQKQLVEAEKMASLGDLVAGVAHEINTPIGIGVTAASHLSEMTSRIQASFADGGIRKSEFETYLQGCSESGAILLANLQRASDLIRSFKQVAVDQSLEGRRVIDLKDYLNDIILNLKPKTKCCDVKIQIRCATGIELHQNPGSIAQIVTNLVMNSLTHAFDPARGGIIRIEAEEAEGIVDLSYSDDGKGIPEADLPRIFEPFFTTRRGQGGSGLGLNIVYNLVTRELGGSISCVSRPGDGTTFHLRFPARGGSDA